MITRKPIATRQLHSAGSPAIPTFSSWIGTADSRFGLLDVYKRLVPAVSPVVEEDLIRIGSDLERGTAFEPFWKLARFRLGASSGHLTPNWRRNSMQSPRRFHRR